jgi:hypothetical protein
MPNIAELRNQYPELQGMSDYDIVDSYAQQNGVSFETIAADLGVPLPNKPGFGTSLKNSVFGTAKGLGQIASDFIPGVSENNALEQFGREGMERNPVDIMSGEGGAFENLGSNLINRPMSTISQIAGQAAGLVLPSGALKVGTGLYRGAKGLGELGKVGKGVQSGLDTTLFGASSYGSMRDQQEAQGENSWGDKFKALGAATAIGSVEKFAGVEALMAGKAMTAPTIGKSILKQATGEAAEEMIQTPIERWGANQDVMSMETLDQMAAGGLAGFVGGGMAGPLTHTFGKTPKHLIGATTEEPAVFDRGPKLGLPNRPNDTMIAFPDGSVGTKDQVDSYVESLPEEVRVSVRATLLGNNDLTLPTVPSAVAVDKPQDQDDASPTGASTALPNWEYPNLPHPKDVVGSSVKKVQAYTMVAKAMNDGLIDQAQFEDFTSEIAQTRKIGKITPKIANEIQAIQEGVQRGEQPTGMSEVQVLQLPVQQPVASPAEQGGPVTPMPEQGGPVAEPQEGFDLAQIANSLAPQQRKVFDAMVNAVQNDEADKLISGDGKLQYQAIAELAGLEKRGAAQAAINQTVGKISKLVGFDVKEYLAEQAKLKRQVAPADETLLGLSPAVQGSAVEDEAIFGSEDGGANMGMAKSIGATDTDQYSVMNNNTRAQNAIEAQGTELLEAEGALDRGTVITPEASAVPDQRVVEEAAAEREALLVALLDHPDSRNALNDWTHDTIKLIDFDRDDMIAYLADYIEVVNSEQFAELTPQRQNRVIDDLQAEVATQVKGKLFNENQPNIQRATGSPQIAGSGNADAGATTRTAQPALVEGSSDEDFGDTQVRGTGAQSPNATVTVKKKRNVVLPEGVESLASNGRPMTFGETRKGAVGNAFDAFYEFGYGSVLLDMTGIKVGDYPDNGLFIPRADGSFEIRIKESLVEGGDRFMTEHTIRHELSHALDFRLDWAFSMNEKMTVEYDGANITGVGPVAKEIIALNERMVGNKRHPFAKYFDYPLDLSQADPLELEGLTPEVIQAELFAQIQAAWMHPEAARAIRTFLPKTAQYLTEVNQYAKDQLQTGDAGTERTLNASAGRNTGSTRGNGATGNERPQSPNQAQTLASNGAAYTGGNGVADRAKGAGADALKAVGNFLKEINPKLLTSNQLVEQYGEKITTLKDYVKTQNEMGAFATQLRESAHKLLEKWGTYAFRNKLQNNRLMSVMHDATQAGIHPDVGFDDELNAHLTVADLDRYDALKAQYDVLPNEAKNIYQESKALLTKNWELRKNIFADVVTAAYAPRIEQAEKTNNPKQVKRLIKERDSEIASHAKQVKELKGPYFPLMRFGDYIVIGESKELADLREQMKNAETGEYSNLAKKAAEMEKNDKHYVVEAFESRVDMEKRKDALSNAGFITRDRKAEVYADENRPVNAVALDKINDALGEGFDKATAAKLKDMMTSMYVQSLPEHHALQRQIRRKGVAGADANMMRSFSEAIERDSFYLSRMRYAKDLSAHLQAMREQTKRMGVDADNVYNNVVQRATADFKYEQTPFISALARLSSIFHLGISPAFLLTNMTQPWFITAPQLAGTFGGAKTFAAMRGSWVDATRIIKQGKGGKMLNLADVDLSVVADPNERAMLERLRDVNKLESNQLLDMGQMSNGMSPTQMKAWKVFNWATHHIEMTNRISTALATYRLEKARNPQSSEEALREKAINMVDLTQLDYSNENAAYFMKPGVGLGKLNKIVFQFRKYQQGMIYLLARDAKKAFEGDKEALRSLGYLMSTQVLMAGTTGLPLTAPLLLALSALGDDDDEEGDAETKIRNYMADMVGPDAARVLWKGIPNALGVDVSNNVGMGNLLKPFPMMAAADVTNAKRGEDVAKEVLFNAAGAPVSMVANFAGAVIDFENGDWARGIAGMTPRFVASLVKANDLAENGISTRSGTEVMAEDQFDGWDIAIKAAGFNPTVVSEHYTAQSAKEDTSRAIQDRRNTLLKQYAVAKLRGEEVTDIKAEIAEFNQAHPKVKLDQSALIRAVQSRRQGNDEMDQAGVRFRKNEESLRGIDRFAY